MYRVELRRQTFYKSAAALHGTVPFAVNASAKIVISFQSVALVTEVLYHCPVGETLAVRRAAAVAPVFWFGRWRTHCKEKRNYALFLLLCREKSVCHFCLWRDFNAQS